MTPHKAQHGCPISSICCTLAKTCQRDRPLCPSMRECPSWSLLYLWCIQVLTQTHSHTHPSTHIYHMIDKREALTFLEVRLEKALKHSKEQQKESPSPAGLYCRILKACSLSVGTELAEKLSTCPRLIKTHLPVQLIPKAFWEQNCKVQYVGLYLQCFIKHHTHSVTKPLNMNCSA